MKDAQAFTEKAMNKSAVKFPDLLEQIQNLADELRNESMGNVIILNSHTFEGFLLD